MGLHCAYCQRHAMYESDIEIAGRVQAVDSSMGGLIVDMILGGYRLMVVYSPGVTRECPGYASHSQSMARRNKILLGGAARRTPLVRKKEFVSDTSHLSMFER